MLSCWRSSEMKRQILIGSLIVLLAGGLAAAAIDVTYKPGQLLVRFAEVDGQPPDTQAKNAIASSILSCPCSPVQKEFHIVPGLALIELPSGVMVEDAQALFSASEDILYAGPNYKVELAGVPNDPMFGQLWGMNNTGQTGGTSDADIDGPEAWDIATGGDNEVVVAVTDTGVDYDHPDLAANMWINTAEKNGTPGFDDDGNGYVDDIYGYDFANDDGDPLDDNFHGTHCSGTVGAVGNNGVGVTGVCWNVKIMAVKFLDAYGSGWLDDAIESVEYAVDNGVDVISASWGGYGYSQALYDAIDAARIAGVLFVAAAGNDDNDNDGTWKFYPASFDLANIISVLATNDDDGKPSFSNYGATAVDLGAPGSDILSTFPTYQTGEMISLGFDTDYETISGTSMAAPHVAGAAALLWSINPALTYSEVKSALLTTVDTIGDLLGLCVTDGRLNLFEAVDKVANAAPTPDPAQWEIGPQETGPHTIAMEAAEATHEAGVEYYFECVSDSNFNSSWQSGTVYERGDFEPNVTYTFRVKARDAEKYNETGFSSTASATTYGPNDISSPFSDPTRWSIAPKMIRLAPVPVIRMKAEAAMDENGPVEYYFRCTAVSPSVPDPGIFDSGWQSSALYSLQSSSLVVGSTYTFKVKARDAFLNETAESAAAYVALVTGPRVLKVPVPYSTIQSAINAAVNGDIVEVSPFPQPPYTYRGLHNRDIDFLGKAITVRSKDPNDPAVVAATVIDVQGTADPLHPHRGFIFQSGEGASSILTGFTIINGYWRGLDGVDANDVAGGGAGPGGPGGNGVDGFGGGIACIGSSPTIRNCIITDCTAQGGDGGLGGDGELVDPLTIILNGGNGGNGGNGFGAGIFADTDSCPSIRYCQISDCNALSGDGGRGGDGLDGIEDPVTPILPGTGGIGGNAGDAAGGGLYCGHDAIIENCTVEDNICNGAGNGGDGGDGGDGYDGDPEGDPAIPPVGGGNGGGGGDCGDVYGGGIYYHYSGTASVLSDCTIKRNTAVNNGSPGAGGDGGAGGEGTQNGINGIPGGYGAALGGGVFYDDWSMTTISGTEVSYNQAGDGGGIYYDVGTFAVLNNSEIIANTAGRVGGGICGGSVGSMWPQPLEIHNCTISDNTSSFGGGGIYLDMTGLTVTGSTISGNVSNEGGGINCFGGSVSLDNCTVSDNSAETTGSDGLGGGVGLWNCPGTIENSVLTGNDSDGFGGAIYLDGWPSAQDITNCLITDNSAETGAGLSCNIGASATVANCTFVGNSAVVGGGVSCAEYWAYVDIVSSILWGNDAYYGPQIAAGLLSGSDPFGPYANVDVSYSDVQYGEGAVFMEDPDVTIVWWLNGNIDEEPMFIATSMTEQNLNYYLSQYQAGQILDTDGNVIDPNVNPGDANSPCVDAGDPGSTLVTTYLTTRTDHVADTDIIDMGYHYKAVPPSKYKLTIKVVYDGYGYWGKLFAESIGQSDPFIIEAPAVCSVYRGTMVYCLAEADEGFRVKQWTNNGATVGVNPADQNSYTVLMDRDRHITVEFGLEEGWFRLITSVDGAGESGSISPAGRTVWRDGTEVALIAEPDNPSHVVIWSGTDNDYSTAQTNTVTMTEDKDVVVKFYEPQILYVGLSGEPGTYQTIQLAINDASDHDIVMIAPGTYDIYESSEDVSRLVIDDKAITIRSTTPEDPGAVTILGGFILGDVGRNTVIEGLTITGKYWGIYSRAEPNSAWFMETPPGPGRDGPPGNPAEGSGMRLLTGASPTVRNCVFIDCEAYGVHGGKGNPGVDQMGWGGNGGPGGYAHGGAVSVGDYGRPVFINCSFVGCFARGGDGGNGGSVGVDDPSPGHGGAWGDNEAPWWWEYPVDDYWRYSGFGGAVYCGQGSSPVFAGCKFTDNYAYGGSCGVSGIPLVAGWPYSHYKIDSYGGAVYAAAGSSPAFISCTFTDNEADQAGPEVWHNNMSGTGQAVNAYTNISYGGAVAFEEGATPMFDGCTFSENVACVGGGMYSSWSDVLVGESSFVNNSAYHGGGMLFVGGSSRIGRSYFNQNQATDPNGALGGGIASLGANTEITDCIISNNISGVSGGGIYISSKDIKGSEIPGVDAVLVKNCLVTYNAAGGDGGGISANWHSDPNIVNCTIANNIAGGSGSYGGGLYSGYGNYTNVINSILWGNMAGYGGQMAVGTSSYASTVKVTYSDIQGGGAYQSSNLWVDQYCTLLWDVSGQDPCYPSNLPGTSLSNPDFVTGFGGGYYLSQADASDDNDPYPIQDTNSPVVDEGAGLADLLPCGRYGYTTRTDNGSDLSRIDMGYHYSKSGVYAEGDFNYDGVVDVNDLIILSTAGYYPSLQPCYTPCWCEGQDLNKDGFVTLADYAKLASYYGRGDTEPPAPDPMTWQVPPVANGAVSVSMIATTAYDNSGPDVRYFFQRTDANGLADSSFQGKWQAEPTFTDSNEGSGFAVGRVYGYRVRAKDLKVIDHHFDVSDPNYLNGIADQNDPYDPNSPNKTEWSYIGYVVIGGAGGEEDTTAPIPNPMTWQGYTSTLNSVTLTATTAYDESGVVYYFEELSGNPGATDSGWQSSPIYTDDGLTANTEYRYRVKARDNSVNQNETNWSSELIVTTEEGGGGGGDTTAPEPAPEIQSTSQYQTGGDSGDWHHQIVAAAVSTDDSGFVEYRFVCTDCTLGDCGRFSSPWVPEEGDDITYDDGQLKYTVTYTGSDTITYDVVVRTGYVGMRGQWEVQARDNVTPIPNVSYSDRVWIFLP